LRSDTVSNQPINSRHTPHLAVRQHLQSTHQHSTHASPCGQAASPADLFVNLRRTHTLRWAASPVDTVAKSSTHAPPCDEQHLRLTQLLTFEHPPLRSGACPVDNRGPSGKPVGTDNSTVPASGPGGYWRRRGWFDRHSTAPNKFQAESHFYRRVCRNAISVDKSTKTIHVPSNEFEEPCPTTVWPCGLPLGMMQGVDGGPSHTCQRLGLEPRRAHESRRTRQRKQRLSGLTTSPEEPIGSRRTLRCKQTINLNRFDRFRVLSAADTLRREVPPSNSTTFMSRLKPTDWRLGKPLPHQLTPGVSPCQPQLPPARASSNRL